MSQHKPTLLNRIALSLISSLLYSYLKTLKLKVKVDDSMVLDFKEGKGKTKASDPYIFVSWHHSLLVGSLVVQKFAQRSSLLLSNSRTVDFLAEVLKKIGHSTIRGSSHKGGNKAMVQLVQSLRDGSSVAITPDGPKGPACQFKPGALTLSQKFGIPIVIIKAHYRHCIRLNTWDRMFLPMPFSKVNIELQCLYPNELFESDPALEKSQLLETAVERIEAKMNQ